jgi:carbon-monoxide dehydrogenase large subunit
VPGVRAVIAGQEIPGHFTGKMIRDMPVLCWDVVRFVGDRVAAVAAETPEAAEDALALIEVDYEELPAVFDPLVAMRPDAPRLHENVAGYDGAPKERLALDLHNGLTRLGWRKGDVDRGFREADLVFEHTFRIPGRHQGYIEPHAGVVAIDRDGRVQVWVSAKNPFGIRSQLAKATGVVEKTIRINVVNVGGEFGGKGDAFDLPVAYFLAHRAERPVKIVMDYAEELMASNPSHPTVVTARSGVMRDGRIVAHSSPTPLWPPGTTPAGSTALRTPPSSTCRFTPTPFPAATFAVPGPFRRSSRWNPTPTSSPESWASSPPSFA